jgi:transposase InsO family protein
MEDHEIEDLRRQIGQLQEERDRLDGALTEAARMLRSAQESVGSRTAQRDAATDVLRALHGVALGLMPHDFKGLCPDDVEGVDVRDPECPACQILIRVDNLMESIFHGEPAERNPRVSLRDQVRILTEALDDCRQMAAGEHPDVHVIGMRAGAALSQVSEER